MRKIKSLKSFVNFLVVPVNKIKHVLFNKRCHFCSVNKEGVQMLQTQQAK